MLPFRSGDPEPRGGSQHLHLNSAEFHPVINCLLSAFPRTAVNSLALKLYNPRVPAGSYFSTCISAGLSGPLGVTKCSLKKGHCQHPVGTTPHGYHLSHIDTSSGQQPDLSYEPLEGMPVWESWPNVTVWFVLLPSPSWRLMPMIQIKAKQSFCSEQFSFASILKITHSGCWTA